MTHFSVRSRLEPLILLDPEPTQMGWRQSRLQDLELPEPEPPKKVAALQHWSLVYPVLSTLFCLSIYSFVFFQSWFVFLSVFLSLLYTSVCPSAHLYPVSLGLSTHLFVSLLSIMVCLPI